MDSPLNSAHLLSRKAEKFLSLSKYDEAIECHQKAADLLDQAMSLSLSSSAHESLRLQRNDHIRQQGLIQNKQQHFQRRENRIDSKQPHSSPCQAHNGFSGGKSDVSVDDFSIIDNVHSDMSETSSLLQFLEGPYLSGECKYRPVKQEDQRVGSKVPKDDKLLIEELSIHNKELRKHVVGLLNELDKFKRENVQLKNKLSAKEFEESNQCKNGHLAKETVDVEKYLTLDLDNIDALDLPPLEVPTFDFNARQQPCEFRISDHEHTVS